MSTYFTEDHEWIVVEGDVASVGITTHATQQLGDLVFVELPDIGAQVEKGADVAVVESVKAASDIYTPVTGEIVEVNSVLSEDVSVLSSEPEAGGWIFKIRLSNASELETLMDRAAYDAFAG